MKFFYISYIEEVRNIKQISKSEILSLIKQYNINEASKNEYLDESIEVNIKFGNQKMNKQPTIRELILNITSEVKEMKSDIKEINDRLDKVETELKQQKNTINEIKTDIKQINGRLDKIENCPTIKKELGL